MVGHWYVGSWCGEGNGEGNGEINGEGKERKVERERTDGGPSTGTDTT